MEKTTHTIKSTKTNSECHLQRERSPSGSKPPTSFFVGVVAFLAYSTVIVATLLHILDKTSWHSTLILIGRSFFPHFEKGTIFLVALYGTITAVFTGLGAIPFIFLAEHKEIQKQYQRQQSRDNGALEHDAEKEEGTQDQSNLLTRRYICGDDFQALSNAIAGGMMLAASVILIVEAFTGPSVQLYSHDTVLEGLALGALFGGIFVILSMKYLHVLNRQDSEKVENECVSQGDRSHEIEKTNTEQTKEEEEDLENEEDSDELAQLSVLYDTIFGPTDSSINAVQQAAKQRKAIMLVLVMFVHSFAEGIAIGVSWSGDQKHNTGTVISSAIALHNVPEGLAICFALIPRGIPILYAAVLAIFSSMPQPIVAIPAFVAVEFFSGILPFGYGFAAGAMCIVVFAELLPDARDVIGTPNTCFFAMVGFWLMMSLQASIEMIAR
eukprot:g423.t1